MEGVRAGEQIENTRQNRLIAQLADLVAFDLAMATLQSLNFLSNLLCGGRVGLHLALQLIDLVVVSLQRLHDAIFELIDYHEVGEPGQQIVDFQQRTFFQQRDRSVDISALLWSTAPRSVYLDQIPRDDQPELLLHALLGLVRGILR